MSISRQTAIRVWTAAGGMCSFDGCRQDLLEHESRRLQGEIAHIVATSSEGPRGDARASSDQLHASSNLLLLCPNHHTEVDADPEIWTIERLHDLKDRHETWVAEQREQGDPMPLEFGSAYLLNARRVLLDPAARGVRDDLDVLDLRHLERFNGLDFGVALHLVTACEDVLRRWNAHAIDLAASEVRADLVGARIRLTKQFFTKNCPAPATELSMTGDRDRDPHLWTRVGGRQAFVPLDPRWFTSNSSYTWFAAGNARFTVLGNLMNATDDELVIAPLVVALPKPEWEW